MGNPGPTDSHPLHGEMPNARFQSAKLIAGADDEGPFLTLAGDCEQARAFSYHYRFHAEVSLRPDATHLDVAVTVENLRPVPLDLMYLAHVNFRPVDDGTLIDNADDRGGLTMRRDLPAGLVISDDHRALVDAWVENPGQHRRIAAGRRIDPEAVLFLDCTADAEGWAHGMQRHPDGAADFISYRAAELPFAVRWISRTGDQDALGLILPATAGADGYSAEKAKGRLVSVAAGEHRAFRYRCGALDPAAAQSLAEHIQTTRLGRRGA